MKFIYVEEQIINVTEIVRIFINTDKKTQIDLTSGYYVKTSKNIFELKKQLERYGMMIGAE